MINLYKIAFVLVLSALTSCGCNWHIKKIKAKCGLSTDTVFKTIEVKVPSVETDTVFRFTHSQTDTTIIREGRLTMKYFYNTHDSTVYLSGKCDTVTVTRRVPVVVNKYKSRAINWNWLIVLAMLISGGLIYLRRPK